jgi:hypothetical protein
MEELRRAVADGETRVWFIVSLRKWPGNFPLSGWPHILIALL